MKRFHLYAASVVLLLFSACSTDNDAFPSNDGGNTPSAALRIEVRTDDFTPAGSTATRATDHGATTTFENGDRIGIIVLDADNNILSGNIPYRYNGSTWSFDSGNGEGKTSIYYDNKATAYLAYFPYSKEADGVTDEDALKAKFPPLSDQRTKAAYRASDLLVWSSEAGNAPLKKLDIAFTHAYSSLSLSPSIACKINGVETSYIPSSVDDVNFTIQGTPHIAYRADDGSYRVIVSPATTAVRWFCSYNSEMHGGTMASTELAKNKRYTVAPILNIGDYTFEKAQVGDFYCKNDKGEGYLIPGKATSLIEAQKAACLGIVMKVGRDNSGNWADTDTYKDKSGNTMSTIRGYVLALKDGNGGSACQWGSFNTAVGTDQEQYTLFCGYSNTQTIKDYAKTNNKTLSNDFPAAYHASDGYETRENSKYASPDNSSGWFFPSAGQCWYWYQNRDVLKSSMDKAGGDGWQDYYLSSSEDSYYPASRAWCVDFYYSNVGGGNKGGSYGNFYVRSCLAF